MHLILHIFKKDVRRLWPGIAVVLSVQAWIAWLGARDAPVDLPDFSLLLMVAWIFLISLAVLDDPLVGDRQFWITRPSRWPVLLGSKLLFAVAVAHGPSFLADVVILAVRGFHPWAWLGSLLTRQLVLAVGLTLPAIALAATMQSLAHVVLSIIAIGGLTAVASSFLPLTPRWKGEMDTRVILFFVVLGAAAAVIVPLQYWRRRTWQSHTIGVAAVLAAELVFSFLSPVFVGRVRAAVYPTYTTIAFHLRTPIEGAFRPGVFGPYSAPGWVEVNVPLSVSGIPEGVGSRYGVQPVELIAPGNRRYTLNPSYIGPDWLILYLERPAFESLRDAKVNLKGTFIMILHRDGQTASLPVGANQPVPGAGRCSSAAIERTLVYNTAILRSRFVNVSCESPAGFTLEPTATLRQGAETDGPGQPLQGSSNPWLVSLLPIARVSGSFRVPQDSAAPASARLEITPDIPRGWQVVNLDLRGLRLRDFAY
jgi:hypothetical protein